jgi:ABC-type sugar transport system substrate-binding protein
MIKKILAFVLVIILYQGCDPEKGAKLKAPTTTIEVDSNEEYVMITPLVNFPMYVNHDQAAFIKWGEKTGVKTSILGPSEWDIEGQIATIEQVIGMKPTGLLINGTDQAITQAINRAVEAGIPTVVYDSDVPQSKRHAFLGTNWYQVGRLQGEKMVELIGGSGKVACLGILGLTNQEAGFQGLIDVLSKYPNIEFIGKFDDATNVETAARITSDLISAHPDLSGICGFNGMSGPGIGLAIREANKIGKIKVTSLDWEPEHLKLVKDGVIQYLVGQKRELFTWYGAQFLFDMVHKTNRFSLDDEKAGITAVPYSVDTGLIEISLENIDKFQ